MISDNLKNGLLNETLANQALNSANDGMCISDMTLPDQPLMYINQAFEDLTGYKKNEVLGKNCRFLQGDLHDQPELSVIRQAIQNKVACRVILKNFKKNGTFFWNELSLAPIQDSLGRLTHYVGIQKDITLEIVQKERIAYLSEHDDLTGLYNYRGLFSKLDSLIEKASKQNLLIGVGIADIDYFKLINDHFGHIRGNDILKLISSQIREEFDREDIVARFGGDEFCFVMTLKDMNTKFFYDKISNVVRSTNLVLNNNIQLSMSAGLVIEKSSELFRIDRLIHLADNIMYKNKQLAHQRPGRDPGKMG